MDSVKPYLNTTELLSSVFHFILADDTCLSTTPGPSITTGDEISSTARVYFKLAADRSHADAAYEYALICHDENIGPEDLSEARAYYKQAAELNKNDGAQYMYGFMCLRGVGGSKNLLDAFTFLARAKEQGHANATALLRRYDSTITETV